MKNTKQFLFFPLIFIFFFYNPHMHSQSSGFTSYTTSNSKIPSNNNIYHVVVDESQNIWIVSDSGLTKFDRTNWVTYNMQNSELPSNTIRNIESGPGNSVWICTDSGLVRIKDGTWTIFNNKNSGLLQNRVWDVAFDSKGNIWIADDKCLIKTDLTNWVHYDSTSNGKSLNKVSKVIIDKFDSLLILCDPGNLNGGNLYKIDDKINSTLISSYIVGLTIGIDSKNTIYFTNQDAFPGIFKYSDGSVQILRNYAGPLGYISRITIDKNDIMWAFFYSTVHQGIVRLFNFSDSLWTEEYYSGNSALPSGIEPLDIAIDSNNVKWIGTFSTGLIAFNDKPIFSNILPNGGESLITGGNFNIKYYSKYSFNSKIELTTDNGSTWHFLKTLNNSINDVLYDSTFYTWTIPDSITTSTKCRIRVSDIINKNIYLESDSNFTITNTTGVKKDITIPLRYSLSNNFPNPFNPSTIIRYSLPMESKIIITVFNLVGQQVRELINATESAGYHEITFNANNLASGIYFYRINAVSTDSKNNFIDTKKLILMK